MDPKEHNNFPQKHIFVIYFDRDINVTLLNINVWMVVSYMWTKNGTIGFPKNTFL
jgi:hypothetical protein